MKLYNRISSFYIVINVPKKLRTRMGKSQIWKSLKTKDKAVAKLRAEIARMIIMQKILNKANKQKLKESEQNSHDWLFEEDDDEDFTVTRQEAKRLYREYMGIKGDKKTKPISNEERRKRLPKEKDFSDYEAERLAYNWLTEKVCNEIENLKNTPIPLEELARYKKLLAITKQQYTNWDYSAIEGEMNKFLYDFFEPRPSENSRITMLNAFMRAQIQFLDYITNFLYGIRTPLSDELITNIGDCKSFTALQTVGTQKLNTMNLIELVEIYNNDISRQNTSYEQKSRVTQRIEVINEIIGSEKQLCDITTDDCDNMVRELQFFPHRFGLNKLTKGLGVREAIAKAKSNTKIQCLSQKTISEYIQTLSSNLNFALKKNYIERNPMESVSLPKVDRKRTKSGKYKAFTIVQLQAIFDMPMYRGCQNERLGFNTPGNKIFRNSKFWIPLIALYTGARLNEICQMLVSDIKQIDGVDVFSINIDDDENKKVKTASAIRNVPIHPELIKIGFLQYVEKMKQVKQKRLFPDLKLDSRGRYSADMSKFFNRFLDEVNKTLINEDDKLSKNNVFHSFRHTMRTALRNNLAADAIAIAIGGWDQGESLSCHYGEGISMPVLLKEIEEKLVYPNLDLNHLYL